MKRPSLVLSIGAFLAALLFSSLDLVALVPLCLISVVVLFIFLFSKNKRIKNCLYIPVIVASILAVSVSSFIQALAIREKALEYENTTNDVTALVLDNQTENDFTSYTLKVISVNSKDEGFKMQLVLPNKKADKLELYDIIYLNDIKLKKTTYAGDIAEKVFLSSFYKSDVEVLGSNEKDFYYYCLNTKNIALKQLSNYLYGDEFGVLAGMLFGGRGFISDETVEGFRNSGIAHLLAVSGLHTGLWAGLVISILKAFKIKEKYANLFGILTLIALSVISGFTPSVLRASFMMGVALIGPFFKRFSDPINSLGLAITVIIISNPFVLHSASFFLSVLATIGVIFSLNSNTVIRAITKKIKNEKVKNLVKRQLKVFMVSMYATIFTIPASIYYFKTISIISPITNLLTVDLAFLAMLLGVVSLVISFLPFTIFTKIATLLFSATEFLLRLLINIATFLGGLKFSVVRATEAYVYTAIAVCIIFTLIYIFALKKANLTKFFRRLLKALVIAPIFVSLILSAIPLKSNTEFLVLSNTSTPNIVIRNGNDYVLINCPEKLTTSQSNLLPKANAEKLELFCVTRLNNKNKATIEGIVTNFTPKTTVISHFVNDTKSSFETEAFNNAIVSSDYEFLLNNKIILKIIDTYGTNCAIIEFNEKIIVLSFSEYNDFKEIEELYGKIDVLILGGKIPTNFNVFVDTIILCTPNEDTIHENDNIGIKSSRRFIRTSATGEVNIKF